FLFSSPDDCVGQSHYLIKSKRSGEPPPKYVQLYVSDTERYPLLRDVMDAFDNPGNYSGATVRDDLLTYEIFEERSERRVTDTNDYLLDRLLTEFGSPLDLPVHFSYVGEKTDETYYYSWSVIVIDHSC
ncbi:MAG: hypothetical protein JSV43_08570, partial [Methanobacteriota archaeon]